MSREIIQTANAPSAIGTYVQAVKTPPGSMVFISGQIPLLPNEDPAAMALVSADFSEQAHQVFKNLAAVAAASGGSLADCVKLTIYLVDLGQFAAVNKIMAEYFSEPYPARAAVEISALPKQAQIEIDAIMVLC
ncbi:MAG: reactive intermediate/imine deaminase [Gammaproteobacteria bacterium]|jgi:reactive intermediate/imine deaminase|nr:reactive intermediate/imine deaminase [Gammaproteobacteria bacterium]